jgi:agmatinase
MSSEKPFFALDSPWSQPEKAGVHILPIPYEVTTSYGTGTADAPEAIRRASAFIELYDEEIDKEIFRLPGGIATLPPLKFGKKDIDDRAIALIYNEVRRGIEREKMVISLGGEHTIAVGAAKAYAEHFSDLSILQLDAHSDLRQEYEGSRFSHAATMARIYDFHKDIIQVGIRSQCIEESDFIRNEGIQTYYAVDICNGRFGSGDKWHDAVIDSTQENVYLTIDCDFFDPPVIPALGTPEPGGFGWHETLVFLRKLAGRKNIVGFDVNELQPIPSLSYPDFTVAKLIYKLIGYIFMNK